MPCVHLNNSPNIKLTGLMIDTGKYWSQLKWSLSKLVLYLLNVPRLLRKDKQRLRRNGLTDVTLINGPSINWLIKCKVLIGTDILTSYAITSAGDTGLYRPFN